MDTQSRPLDMIQDLLSGKEIFFKYIKTVGDIMTREPIKMTLDMNLAHALKLFKKHKIRHLPVIDIDEKTEKEYFVGILSERDVLRQLSPGVGTLTELPSDPVSLKMPCSQIVTRHPETVNPESALYPAIETMLHMKVDCIPVVSANNTIIGILTSTDVLRMFIMISRLAGFVKSPNKKKKRLIDLRTTRMRMTVFDPTTLLQSYFQTVGDIMTDDLLTLPSRASLDDAIELIQENRIRHIPIVNEVEELVGIVSDRDLLWHLPANHAINSNFSYDKDIFRSRLFIREGSEAPIGSRVDMRHVMVGGDRLITVTESTNLVEAVELMMKKRIHSLLVLENPRDLTSLCGILTSTDIMRAVSMLQNLVLKDMDPKKR